MPPGLVTSAAQSWIPSVCRFDVTFCAPVCDCVKPIVIVLVWPGALLPVVVVCCVPPHAAATRPASANATAVKRMLVMSFLLGSPKRSRLRLSVLQYARASVAVLAPFDGRNATGSRPAWGARLQA